MSVPIAVYENLTDLDLDGRAQPAVSTGRKGTVGRAESSVRKDQAETIKLLSLPG